jgi:hypothetical protein
VETPKYDFATGKRAPKESGTRCRSPRATCCWWRASTA